MPGVENMDANTSMPEMGNNMMWLTVSQPLINMMGVQGEMLSRMADMAETWGRNRRQDAEATQDAVRRMSESRDANQISAIFTDWMRGTMERASNDLTQYANHAQGMMSAGMAGAKQMQQEGTAAAKEATSKMAKAAE
jgi:hypothetical protein